MCMRYSASTIWWHAGRHWGCAVQYEAMHRRSLEQPEEFWAEHASQFYWHKQVSSLAFTASSCSVEGDDFSEQRTRTHCACFLITPGQFSPRSKSSRTTDQLAGLELQNPQTGGIALHVFCCA